MNLRAFYEKNPVSNDVDFLSFEIIDKGNTFQFFRTVLCCVFFNGLFYLQGRKALKNKESLKYMRIWKAQHH